MSDIAALDIGGTKLAAGLIREDAILQRRIAATPADSAERLVEAAAGLLSGWDVAGLALAVTGYPQGGRVWAVNRVTIAGWHGFALEEALRRRLGFAGPLLMLNDAAAAAWAEHRARGGRFTGLGFVTVSTGIGGGLVIGGELLTGPRGLAGHIGHMRMADHGACGCGRIGCAEAIAGGRAIAEAGSRLAGTALTAAQVFARAEVEPAFVAIIDGSARIVADLAADLRLALDLDLVVLGGGVGLAPGYLDRVRRHLATQPEIARVPLEAAICGADAGLLGAAARLRGNFTPSSRPSPASKRGRGRK